MKGKEIKSKTVFKNKLPLLFFILIITVGLIISIIGIYLVSQQKRVKELNLERELTEQLNKSRDSAREMVMSDLNKIYTSLSEPAGIKNSDNKAFYEDIKKKIDKNKFCKFPFLINSSGKILFPDKEVPVLPLEEAPNELQLFKNAKLLIQFILKWDETLFSNQIFLNIKSQELYKRGLISEFRKNDFKNAIFYYKKAILINKQKHLAPIIFNSIGRCRYKSGKYKKAAGMYLMIINRFGHLLKDDLSFLRIRIWRSLALSAYKVGDMSKATKSYLRILELILFKRRNRREIFVFFKNEAINFLMKSGGKYLLNDSKAKFEKLKIMESEFYHSSLDNQLKKLLSSSREVDLNIRINKIEKKMKEIFKSYQKKIYFYSSLKNLYHWDSHKFMSLNIIEFKTVNIKNKYSICVKNLQVENTSPNPVFLGFIFDQDKYEKKLILSNLNKELLTNDLKIGFANHYEDSRYKYPVIYVQFKNFFHWNSLIFYSNIDDYIGKKVRKELRVNYLLIAVLILTFILFIFLFYKYISREADLLKLKSNFVDSVSHTLKTPLTRISLLAENVESGWVKDEKKKKEFLQTIISESYKMNDMINNMLNFSKIDAGKKHYDMKMDSLSEIISSVVDNYSEYIIKLGFDLEISIDKNIPDFNMDREAIKTILINLLQNAIKYSSPEKYIRIALFKDEEKIVLEIEDRGFGISKKEQKKIFEKYYRTQSKQVKSLEGSGLGLYLIKNAVAAHKGEIKVKSEPDHGSTFSIIFSMEVESK